MAESPKTITLNIEYKKPPVLQFGDKVLYRPPVGKPCPAEVLSVDQANLSAKVRLAGEAGPLNVALSRLSPLDISQDDVDEPDALPTDFKQLDGIIETAVVESGGMREEIKRAVGQAYNIGFVSGRQPLDDGLPDMETASPAENRFEALGFGGPRTIRTEPGEYEFVQAPVHYNDHPSGVECQEIIRECKDPMVAFAMKHLWRSQWGAKPGQSSDQDISKAIEYLQLEQARREGKKRL